MRVMLKSQKISFYWNHLHYNCCLSSVNMESAEKWHSSAKNAWTKDLPTDFVIPACG
jgi:hypothetical protein